jgi:hypothetical protein
VGHLATSEAVVLRSEIKVTSFDLQNFSFASSPSHIWVTNPYSQHGDTTERIIKKDIHKNYEKIAKYFKYRHTVIYFMVH